MNMNRLNFVLKKFVTYSNSPFKKSFSNSKRGFNNLSSVKPFSSNEVSFNFNNNLNTRSIPLDAEIKRKKSEEIFEAVYKKYEQV